MTEKPGALFGTVTVPGAPDGSNVRVSVNELSVLTGADGNYLLESVPAGTYSLAFSRDGYQPRELTVTVVAGERTQADVTLEKKNLPPILTGITVTPDQLKPVATAEAVVAASDPEGGALTYTWSADNGFTVTAHPEDPTRATVTAPSTNATPATVTVVVRDPQGKEVTGNAAITTLPNHPPVVVSLTATPNLVSPGEALTVTAVTADEDQDLLDYHWTLPSGWSHTGTGATLTVTAPNSYGKLGSIQLELTDGRGGSAQASVSVGTGLNRGPIISSLTATPPQVAPGATLTLDGSAFDPDNDTLTYAWQAPAGWTLVGTPTGAQAQLVAPAQYGQTGKARLTVTDVAGVSVSAEVSVSTQQNRSPLLAALTATPSTVFRGNTVTLRATASDPDGDALSYQWSVPGGWTLAPSRGGTLSSAEVVATAPNTPGITGLFDLTVSDGHGGTTSGQLSVSTQANSGPLISSVTATPPLVAKGGTTTVTVSASDPDNEPLSYTWSAPPGWTVTPSTTGTSATVTAPNTPGEVATLQVEVRDQASGLATGSVVVSTQSNRSPVISTFTATPSSIRYGGTLTLAVSAQDADGDTLSYSYQSSNATLWPVTGNGAQATVTAPATPGSTATLTVNVSDSEGAVSSSTVVVSTLPNGFPVISSLTGTPNPVPRGGTLALAAAVADPDGDSLTYAWSLAGAPAGWTLTVPPGDEAHPSLAAPAISSATATVLLTVTDAFGGATQSSLPVSTLGNRVPHIQSLTSTGQPVLPGAVTDALVTATDDDGDSLTYQWTLGNSTWVLNGTGPAITVNAPYSSFASSTLTVQVTDGHGGVTQGTLLLSTAECGGTSMNCDRAVNNGCEADLSSESHCGACGNTCASGDYCQAAASCQPLTAYFDVQTSATVVPTGPFALTVVARDGAHNPVTTYRGTVRLQGAGPLGALPADYTFTDTDNGVHVFQLSAIQTGAITVGVQDVARTFLTGQASVTASNGPGTETTPAVSCKQLLRLGGSAGSGVYWLSSGGPAYRAYCDMTTDGGGWTTFFAGINGSWSNFNFFEDTAEDCPEPSSRCVRRLPSALPLQTDFAAFCGDSGNGTPFGVRFNVNAAILNFFQFGMQADWQPTSNQASLSGGGNPERAHFLYTGNSSRGWILSSNRYEDTFASTYLYDSNWNRCNGGWDASTVTRLMYREADPHHFRISMSRIVAPGAPSSVTVTAVSQSGVPLPDYTGTVQFSSSDVGPGVGLPADYTFTPADQGTHVFTGLVLDTAGEQNLTVTDAALVGVTSTAQVRVSNQPGSATNPAFSCSRILESAPQNPGDGIYWINPDGTAFPVFCDMTTAGGGWTTYFAGINGSGHVFNHFESTADDCVDPERQCLRRTPASLAVDAEFLSTCGEHWTRFEATPGAYSYFQTGTQSNWQPVTVLDQSLSTNAALVSAMWTGSGGDFGWILGSPANWTTTFASFFGSNSDWDGCNGISDRSSPVRLMYRDLLAAGFSLSGPMRSTPGVADSITVRAVDASGRTKRSFTGTVHFSSTDTGMGTILPSDYTFVAGDQGEHTFSVTFSTQGPQTLTVADVSTPTREGSLALEVGVGLGSLGTPANSCAAIQTAGASLGTGLYWIQTGGAPYLVHCEMDRAGGGWTLALRADGAQTTFRYDSTLWTTNSVYQPQAASQEGAETKLESFNSLGASEMLLLVRSPRTGTLRQLHVSLGGSYANLLSLFGPGTYVPTSLGRETWRGLFGPTASLQPNCNMEGFNVTALWGSWASAARIGIITNNEWDCDSSDSHLGIGTQGTNCGTNDSLSVGVSTRCGGDLGDTDVTSLAAVYIR